MPPPGQSLDPAWASQSNLPRILSVTGVIHLLALASVGLRLYVRIGLLRTPGVDDGFVVGAVIAALGGYICFLIQAFHGLGRHTLTISRSDQIVFDHVSFAQSVISAIGALGLLKISIALFLRRLNGSGVGKKWFSGAVWGLIVFVCIYTIGAWLTFFLRCRPMSGFWERNPKAKCYSIQLFMTFAQINTAFNIFTDVCFATLPIPIIWNLQMSQRTRMNLIGILSLGYLAVAMGIVKAIYQIAFGKNTDRHFEQSVQFWGFLQLNIGIIAASIPTLKPLLKGTPLTTSNRYTPYINDRSDKSHAKPSRPRRSFLSHKDTTTPEEYEMSKRMAAYSQSRQHNVYSVNEEREGSEDFIFESGGVGDKRGIMCTREVRIDNEKMGDNKF